MKTATIKRLTWRTGRFERLWIAIGPPLMRTIFEAEHQVYRDDAVLESSLRRFVAIFLGEPQFVGRPFKSEDKPGDRNTGQRGIKQL
jgi:hypothetical protein